MYQFKKMTGDLFLIFMWCCLFSNGRVNNRLTWREKHFHFQLFLITDSVMFINEHLNLASTKILFETKICNNPELQNW